MSQLLKLGYVDKGCQPTDLKEYFSWYHFGLPIPNKLRGDKNGYWAGFKELDSNPIKPLQEFFRSVGFYPYGDIDGIYGYRLLSATRLFQEYVRNIEGHKDIGNPDGIIGKNTYKHIDRWKAENIQADWVDISKDHASDEFIKWINYLNKVQSHYQKKPSAIMQMMNEYQGETDTLKPDDWSFHPKHIHLIGIRRQEWKSTNRRANDDLFVLLINGMVFKFYGSTDPSQRMASRKDEPFLVPGQHDYGFGWHRLKNGGEKCYPAFRPAKHGVLVFRDIDNDNALTEADIARGFTPNKTINVHWTGHGTSVWSAGCQVICGKDYINHHDQVIDCSDYSSSGYKDLGPKTRGAYNVITDLISIFVESGTHAAKYTLIYEKDLAIDPIMGADYAEKTLARLL